MKFKFENFELRFWKLDFEIKELSFTRKFVILKLKN